MESMNEPGMSPVELLDFWCQVTRTRLRPRHREQFLTDDRTSRLTRLETAVVKTAARQVYQETGQVRLTAWLDQAEAIIRARNEAQALDEEHRQQVQRRQQAELDRERDRGRAVRRARRGIMMPGTWHSGPVETDLHRRISEALNERPDRDDQS